MRICHNKCRKYGELDSKFDVRYSNKDSFKMGYGRCRECGIFIKEFTWCPCCSSRISFRPKNNIAKRKFNEARNIVRY